MSNASAVAVPDLDAIPLAHPVNAFAKALGVSRSKVYEEIRLGRLRAKKLGSRTLPTPATDGCAYLDSLPDVKAAA